MSLPFASVSMVDPRDIEREWVELDDLRRLNLAKGDHSVGVVSSTNLVFHLFDQDADDITNLRSRFFRPPFVQIDSSFTFESDIDQCPLVVDLDDLALNDFTFLESGPFLLKEAVHVCGGKLLFEGELKGPKAVLDDLAKDPQTH